MPEEGMKLHHVGIVVEDLFATAQLYVQRYGYRLEGNVSYDPAQGVNVLFLAGEGDRLELVQAAGEKSFVNKPGIHHVCYEVDDIEAELARLRTTGMVILQRPVPAVAFAGRRIAWLIGYDRVPIELLER